MLLQLTGIISLKLLQKAEVHMDLVSFCYILFNFAVWPQHSITQSRALAVALAAACSWQQVPLLWFLYRLFQGKCSAETCRQVQLAEAR